MRKQRYTATVVRDARGRVHVRVGMNGVDDSGNVTVIEAFEQREGESTDELRERARAYIEENGL